MCFSQLQITSAPKQLHSIAAQNMTRAHKHGDDLLGPIKMGRPNITLGRVQPKNWVAAS